MIEITKQDLLNAKLSSQKFDNIGGDVDSYEVFRGNDITWDIYTMKKDGQDISIAARYEDSNTDLEKHTYASLKEYEVAQSNKSILRESKPLEVRTKAFSEPVSLFVDRDYQYCASSTGAVDEDGYKQAAKSLKVQFSPCAEEYFKECAQNHLIENVSRKINVYGKDFKQAFDHDIQHGTFLTDFYNDEQVNFRLHLAAELGNKEAFKDLYDRGADINNPKYADKNIQAILKSGSNDIVSTAMIDMNLEATPRVRDTISQFQDYETGQHAAKILNSIDRVKDLESSLAVKPQMKQERRMKI
ncbi:ankyrin repeat domain-containing protein [Diaphorobacter aerolatus]|uniref:Ankyrin repeat domain-containing protein n=1 Tax=Diaphorobacter aerolatus TaxID=1288495 RepID=A0A7H0GJ95_9BURK|nr:ankyrin repeat domain-containing protein [Diaphorobacter aerolatus]QNP48361.1 ankyrin repeat domain-containing protein [Diaphorobacter aerolatus]